MSDYKGKIKSIRLAKRLKQAEVARIAGIKQSSLASIEKPISQGGTKDINLETAKGIANALGVPFNELFDIELSTKLEQESLIDEITQLKERINELEEQIEDKRKIIKFLSDNDFTLEIAAKIYHIELDRAGLRGKKWEYNMMEFGMSNKEGLEFTEEEKKLLKTPYDPGDKQSQIRYIEKWFTQLEENNRNKK